MHDQELAIKRQMLRRINAACPSCHDTLNTHNIGVLGHEGSLWLLVIVCQSCQSYKVAAVVRPQPRPVAPLQPVNLTELLQPSAAEPNGDAVDVDDVLDMHTFLQSFDGDFAQLFSGNHDPGR